MWTRERKDDRRRERITLNLASMIDVTFLLLIYFLVTAVLAEPEDRLTPDLQVQTGEAAGREADLEPQVLEVLIADGQPIYRLGSIVMASRAELRERLDALPRSAGVFIRVGDGVPVGFAVTAIQVARDLDFEQVTYVPHSP
ncbi:MAG: biopolymer transporter ExbD [Phycisphaerales bacterium]|nr:MAG: biopolymer transporter ExbD [Phycisphaerales bacterium]